MHPLDEIEKKTPGHDEIAPQLLELARARFDHDPARAHEILGEIGRVLARVQASSDMIGRATMRLRLKKRRALSFSTPMGEVPKILPWDAILDLIERDPVFAASADEVREVYSHNHGFALARAVDQTITAKVHDAVLTSFHSGKPIRDARELVFGIGQEQGIEAWSQGYAQTVVRTNATTAYAAGEFREAEALEREGRIAGLRFVSALDRDTRPNHKAAHGLVARVSDPVWDMLSPPLGFNCRCGLVPAEEIFTKIPDHARIPAGAHPDLGFGRGFGQRPDRPIYG